MMTAGMIILQLFLQFGPKTAKELWELFGNNEKPTDADWAKLEALAQKKTSDYINEAKTGLATG